MDVTDNTRAPAPVGALLDRSTMNEQQRRLFDAQADHEAWSLAHEILEPWVETTKAIGSDRGGVTFIGFEASTREGRKLPDVEAAGLVCPPT